MDGRLLWTGSARRGLVLMACLLAGVCVAPQAQTPTLRMTTEYLRDGATVASGTLEYPVGEFQFFTMKPYTGATNLRDPQAPAITLAFAVRAFKGTNPAKGAEEPPKFSPRLVIKVYASDKQLLRVLSKTDNLFYPVTDVGKYPKDAYLSRFKWTVTTVPPNKDARGYVELDIDEWPTGDPCFGL
jgi:hypothetical protein